jgi:RNA polymerase sigma-70 factor (ECF subfamily)
MSQWPKTRVTLLARLENPQDQEAWEEFVALYGPSIFHFARRRLPQDEDAADIMQEVLSAVLRGNYERPKGRFQKWLLTILLNKIRNFHAARARRAEVVGHAGVALDAEDESPGAEEEWETERRRYLLHAAADRVRQRCNPAHWNVFVRTALDSQTGQQVARALKISVTNVYAIKSRMLKEIKEEIDRLEEDPDDE